MPLIASAARIDSQHLFSRMDISNTREHNNIVRGARFKEGQVFFSEGGKCLESTASRGGGDKIQ